MDVDPLLHTAIFKLKQLDCPFLASKEDWWIQQLLVEPGRHRFQLLEWFISKLSLDRPEVSHTLNSPGEKVSYFVSAFYSLGLCKKTDKNLMQGNAKKSKQVRFWKLLTDILWEQAGFPQLSCSESSGSFEAAVENEYNKTNAPLQKIVSSVAVKDLFTEKVSFVPPDITEDVDRLLSTIEEDELKSLNIPSLEELKSQINENSLASSNPKKLQDSSSLFNSSEYNFDSPSIAENIVQVDDLNMALRELSDNCIKFTDVHNNLKPILKSTDHSIPDVGIKFKNECLKLEQFLKIFADAKVARKANSHLEEMKVDCNLIKSDLHLSLPGEVLQDYISIMKESLNQ